MAFSKSKKEVAEVQVENGSTPPKKKRKIVLIIVLAVVALIIVGTILTDGDDETAPSDDPTTATGQEGETSTPSEADLIASLKQSLDGVIGEGEKISDVSLSDKTLSVTVDLEGVDPSPLTIEGLAESRANSIGDEILKDESLDPHWDKVIVDFGEVGLVSLTKSNIIEDDVDGVYVRYFDSLEIINQLGSLVNVEQPEGETDAS